jgi:hypothetical protein
MAYELVDVIDLSKLYGDIEPHYTWRIYINKDRRTSNYKIVVSGLSRREYLNIYGTKEEVKAKIKDLIKHLEETLEELDHNPFA